MHAHIESGDAQGAHALVQPIPAHSCVCQRYSNCNDVVTIAVKPNAIILSFVCYSIMSFSLL